MTNRIRELYVPNIYEFSAFVVFAGFRLFPHVVYGLTDNEVTLGEQGSTYSILYRAFCLLLSIIIIYKTSQTRKGLFIPRDLKWTFGLFILMSIKLIYALFLAPYSRFWTSSLVFTRLSFLVGVTMFPLYALLLSFKYIDWNKVFVLIIVSLSYVCLSTLLNTQAIDTRIDLNSHQSTLTFGAYSAYIIIISICFLNTSHKKVFSLFLCFAIAIGVLGLLRAGSRGPFVSAIASLFPLLVVRRENRKYLFLIIIGILFFGSILYAWFQEFAPVIFERLVDASNKDTSTMERLTAFELAFEQMNNYPLTGESPIFYTEWAYGFGPHNLWLQIGMGLGYIGFICGIVLFVRYFFHALYSLSFDHIDAIFGSLLIYFLIRTQTGVDIYNASDFGMVLIGSYMYIANRYDY